MNFFTYETQVSRGLGLIGRSSVPKKSQKAALNASCLSGTSSPTKGGGGGGRRSLPSPRQRRNMQWAAARARSSSPERGDPSLVKSRSSGDLGARLAEDPCLRRQSSSERIDDYDLAALLRREEVTKEVVRVLAFERSAFPSLVDWAFAVLGVRVAERTLPNVQRCYRSLMKKLHPDKATQSRPVVDTVEKIHEARAICERSLCRDEVPGPPRALSVLVHCLKVGERRLLLRWMAPERQEQGPVQRYIVAAADPTGSSRPPIRLSTLEPDYSQELGRYVNLEELGTFELREEDFAARVPGLFPAKKPHFDGGRCEQGRSVMLGSGDC